MLQEINDNNFDQLVIFTKEIDSILVDFWAPWCAPCRSLAILLEEIFINEYKTKMLFFKINVDNNPKISSKYKIRSIPTIILFKNGEKKDVHVGIISKEDLRKKLDNIININK
ncbi:thioredoxin [Blattabacterium cuenoti]|uniref:thioredoxin n=1 Tax=Blattabacterium cuenoti TaxID=1653831 RepID=UPI00163CA551|nr:thioredoxin [Blattabacterium cuenoti]